MEDPERSTLSSLDLYSDMIGETEEMTGEMEEMSDGGRVQADLYSDMIEGTEEMNERGMGQADLYSDMLGETEEMSEEGRGQVEEHSVMSSMDLYEDIIEEERENEKFEELRSEVTKTAGQMEDLMAQMEHVQTEKQSLAAENRALKKNISVLFVTAKSELDRKQKEIAQLRADLDMLRMRRGAPRIPHSTRPFDNRSDHSRPGPSGRESTITREASSTHRDVADRQPGGYRQNYQQGESPERDRSRREGAGVSKSHPEQRNFRCSQSPEKDQDRRDGTRDRTCHSKHTKSDPKSRETKQQTGEKTGRSTGEGSTPRQASQDRDKLKTKETEEIKSMDGKTEEHVQERSKSAGERTGPHTPTYAHPDSEQEATVGQTCLKEPVPGGPKTPPEPYPYEDAAYSSKLMNDSERHHKQEGGRHKIPGDEKNRKHTKERQKDSAYHSSGSKSLRGREHSLEDRREEHKQEGYRNKMSGHDEGRGHSVEGKKDSAYCSSGSESLGRHSRENSSEKKREEYEKDKRRGEDSRLDSKTRKETRHASRDKHQKDGSHEKLEYKKEEHEPDRGRENNISSGDLRQKLSQKKRSRDRGKGGGKETKVNEASFQETPGKLRKERGHPQVSIDILKKEEKSHLQGRSNMRRTEMGLSSSRKGNSPAQDATTDLKEETRRGQDVEAAKDQTVSMATKHLPTSFEGSLHSSRSREVGLQDRIAASTSPVGGSSFHEDPIETDAVEEGIDALDKQDTAVESQKHYKDSDKLKEKTDHPTSPHRGKSDREKTIHNSPDCATEAGSSQQPVTTVHQLQEKHDESEMEEEVTSTTTEQPDRGADVRVRVDSDSCAEELGSILAPVKRKREDTKQGHKKAAQNTPTKKGRLSPRKNAKRSPSKKVKCSPKKSPKKIPQEVAESEITPNTPVSPQKTPKKLVKSPQTSPKKVTMSPQDTSTKKVFKSPQKTPKKSSATPKKKSKSPRKTENLVEKCRSIVWTGKSAKGKTVNLFHIEYETAENAAREPSEAPTPQLNLSARSSDLELPSGEESCSLPLPAISAQLKTDKRDMEQPIPSYHGSLSFSSFHGNTDTNLKSFNQTEKVNQQEKEQSLPESLKSGMSSQLPFVPSEDTSRSGGSSLEEQDFPQTVVPFSGVSEVSETREPVSTLLPTKKVKQQTNSESTGPFEVSISAESVTPDSDLKDNIQTQDGHASPQKRGEEKEDDLTSTGDRTAEDDEKATVAEETEELPLKTDEELRRSVETSLLSISNEFDSSTANLSNEELFAVEVLAQLAAAAKTPTHSPVKSAFSLQQASPRKGGTGNVGTKKSPMKVAVTGSTPYRLFSPGRLEPTIAAEVEVGSGCTPKKGSRQRKSAMDSPFIPPQLSAFGSKKEKIYKKSIPEKGSKKADEKKKRDRKDSRQSAEVLAIPEQDIKTKKTKVPPQEVRPLRSSPRKPQGKTADAARLPRKSPRKPSYVTPVKSREEEAAVTDISQLKTKGSLQENQTLAQHNHKEARKTSTSPSVARSSDHNTASASYCVWQTRQTPERERESTLTDLEQNSCPNRLPHDNLEDMPNMLVLSPKSNGFQTRLMKKNVTQSETSAHNRSEANKPSLATKIGTTNNKQIINSTPATIQSVSKSNERDLLTVPTSSKKCVSQNVQQTECSKDSPGTTSPKAHDVQNTKETVPNDSLSKQIQKQPDQAVSNTSSLLHPPHNRPGTNLGEKAAGIPARQHEDGGRVDLSASKGDSKVVKEVEPMQTGETTESLAASASTEENQAPLGKYKVGRTGESQTPLSQEKQEANTGKSTLGEEELDVAAKHGVQTSAKPQPQTSHTSEENAAHNSIETAASFNSDTSLPRPSTPTGLREEMTLDQFSVLDPDDLRCQSAMSIDVRLIPSTPSGKMGPPSRGATPSGKDAAPTPGKSHPALPKTPAEKRLSGAFRQLFNSPPGGRFASTPATERPKPPRFQLDMSVISTGKEEDSQHLGTPVVGETADKTRQDIGDTLRKADIVKQCETVDIAVQRSRKLHTKDLKHAETDKMHGQTEKERKTSGEMKTWTSSGSGRVNTIIASSYKLAPPRRLPSKTDAFRKHLADENLKKDSEDTKQQKEESHKKIKSVRTPVKNMKRKDLDPSDFFPDVSSDEDDFSDGLGYQEVPPPDSKVSPRAKETIGHVEVASSVRKQSLGPKAPWQQQAEETAKRSSVDMPSASESVAVDMPSASASAKVSLSHTSSVNQPMKQINTTSPAAAVSQKDPTRGEHKSDRQASITFGKAVPGKDKASNNNTVTHTAMVEAGISCTVTTPKGKGTGLCSVQSKTGPVAWEPQLDKPSKLAHAIRCHTIGSCEHSDTPKPVAPFTLHKPCGQKSVIPTPLPSEVEDVAIQGPMPSNSSADGIFRVPLPPMNREPPPQPVSQPTPPVYVAERPVIKLNKFSYAAICALEANYGYEWLWPVKPQAQESLPTKQEPDFLSSTTGSQEAKLFVTTCESNVTAHQPSPLHSQQFPASTQTLQPVAGGKSQKFSAITSSVAVGNQNHRNARTGRDRTSGVVTSKVEGKTVKELLSKSRRQQGKVQQQTDLVTGVAMNTGQNNQVLPGVPQAAQPRVTGVFSARCVTDTRCVTGDRCATGDSYVTHDRCITGAGNIFDALSGERLGVSNTPVGTPVLTSQQENIRTGPTFVMPPTPNQQKLKQGTPCTTPKDVPPHTQTPDSKTCNKRITSPNPDIWYQAFGSPKAAAQNTEMYETQKTTAHKEKGTGEPKAVVKKCLEENHQEADEGDLSEGEIISDDEDVTMVKSSGTSSYRDSHCREKPYTGTSKRNEDSSSARQNNRQHSEQRVKDDRNSHRSRGQKASDMKRDRKHTEHSRHGSRRPASEEVRLREQNYKEGWGRGGRGRTEHGRGEKVPRDRAPASWEGEQVSRKASKVERKARR
ncbi:CASP8 associated protein 2 [Branchiostoma belcheri]|nr:CASP8 associated protein 2 [Branchiostoma belcheri]